MRTMMIKSIRYFFKFLKDSSSKSNFVVIDQLTRMYEMIVKLLTKTGSLFETTLMWLSMVEFRDLMELIYHLVGNGLMIGIWIHHQLILLMDGCMLQILKV